MVTSNVWVCAVVLAMLLTGCAQVRRSDDVSNFTIACQCGNAPPLPFKVVGNVYMDVRELMGSNCSVHGADRVITARCPRAELPVSPLAIEAERYLQLAANQSES